MILLIEEICLIDNFIDMIFLIQTLFLIDFKNKINYIVI